MKTKENGSPPKFVPIRVHSWLTLPPGPESLPYGLASDAAPQGAVRRQKPLYPALSF